MGLHIVDTDTFAQVVRDRRLALGLSQAEVAAQVGASRQWVIDMEKGKPRAELGMALALLEVLGISLQVKRARQKAKVAVDTQTGEAQIQELAAAFDFLN